MPMHTSVCHYRHTCTSLARPDHVSCKENSWTDKGQSLQRHYHAHYLCVLTVVTITYMERDLYISRT